MTIALAALLLAGMQADPGAVPPPPGQSAEAPQDGPAIEAPGPATDAALRWLALVDGGDYERSWQQTGALFRARVTQPTWSTQLTQARRPLGATTTRRPDGEQPLRSLPDAPDGSYRLLRFDTDFAAQKGAVETLVMAQETGGWRVIGYFVGDGVEDATGDSPPPATRR